MLSFASPEFWIALSQIVLINIVLSGDNAVVIALACRSLPPHQQKKAIVFGSVGAIVLRVVLTFFGVMLLDLPYLKLIGAAALLWIGVGLLKSDDGEENLEGHSNLHSADHFWQCHPAAHHGPLSHHHHAGCGPAGLGGR